MRLGLQQNGPAAQLTQAHRWPACQAHRDRLVGPQPGRRCRLDISERRVGLRIVCVVCRRYASD